MSICSQFFGPSRMALIGDIVPVEERPRAISLLSLSFNIGLLLGEALAAPLYVVGGVRWALLFDALSFLLSFAAIFLLHAPEAAYSLKRAEQPHFGVNCGPVFVSLW
jgi:MFS family permease